MVYRMDLFSSFLKTENRVERSRMLSVDAPVMSDSRAYNPTRIALQTWTILFSSRLVISVRNYTGLILRLDYDFRECGTQTLQIGNLHVYIAHIYSNVFPVLII